MKLISVQSRGNRLVIIEAFEDSFQVIGKEMFKNCFASRFFYQTMIEKSALQAAENWLKGAKI